MASKDRTATAVTPEATGEDVNSQPNHEVPRRSFLKGMGVAGVALSAGAVLPSVLNAQGTSSSITTGDAAILRFLAAAEILETDLWLQYQELAGTQDDEVAAEAAAQIPNYPATSTGGNTLYTNAVKQLDGDMDQYI